MTVQTFLSDKEFKLDKIEKFTVGQVGWYKSYSYKDEDGFEFKINQFIDEPKELKEAKLIEGKFLEAIKIENGKRVFKYVDADVFYLTSEEYILDESKKLSDFEGTKYEIIISGHFSLDKREKES